MGKACRREGMAFVTAKVRTGSSAGSFLTTISRKLLST